MFTIEKNEFHKIMSVLFSTCITCKDSHCTDCDIDKVFDILHKHLESNISEDDELPY